MKKIILLTIMSTILAGCANTTIVDTNIAKMDSIKLKEIGGNSFAIDTYSVIDNFKSNKDKILACVASSITNSSITLNDNAGSNYSTKPEEYKQINNTYSVSGGNTIAAVTSNQVVANGVTQYYTNSLIPTRRDIHYVRYVVKISPQNNQTKYVFSKIEHAAQNTGTNANRGFGDVGSWSEDNPMLVIKSLDKEVKNISSCLVND